MASVEATHRIKISVKQPYGWFPSYSGELATTEENLYTDTWKRLRAEGYGRFVGTNLVTLTEIASGKEIEFDTAELLTRIRENQTSDQ